MSYASKLAAMSRAPAPESSPRVIGGEAEAPREDHVETEVRAPASVQAAPAQLARGQAPVPAAPRELARNRNEQSIAPRGDDEPHVEHAARDTIERHTVERHTVEYRHRIEAGRADSSELAGDPPPAEHESIAMPAPAQWLEEDRSAPDPLVGTAENDALRELMQRVRQWTSSAPTVIEPAKPTAPASPSAAPAPSPPEPTHVSIGNVVITVEDAAPAQPRGARAPSPARSTTDRMARNHIRGG